MKKRPRATRPNEHARGLTLIEVLVAMGLLSLIMILLVQILVPGLRLWRHARALADIEQQAMAAEERISLAVLSTRARCISTIPNPVPSATPAPSSQPAMQAIATLSHAGSPSGYGYDEHTGRPQWRHAEVFYVKASDQILYHSNWNGTQPVIAPLAFPTASSLSLSSAQLTTVCGASARAKNRLASGVTELALRRLDPDDPAQPNDTYDERFELSLTLKTQTPRGEKTLDRKVVLTPRMREREDE